ncbi:MAG: c-type cytochrome [Burkholderiales bacterium]|nr:c-type cytochrome [Burkholderiales bacterium]
MRTHSLAARLLFVLPALATPAVALANDRAGVLPPGAADKHWRLAAVPMPRDNPGTPARIDLGKALFFDPRLSGNGATSCASCHNPSLGWADGLKKAAGVGGAVLGRATPTITNTGYNTQFMWDGRAKSLEDQALGPMKAADEMNTDFPAMLERLRSQAGYVKMFEMAYPGEGISEATLAKALAAFERTVTSRNSPFDRWLAGDSRAMTQAQWRGYKVFSDPARGNCATCHSAPNFTDNGFHNIGIASTGTADPGRYGIRKVASMRGAFKTPTLRDIELTAPYFHDGSAATLLDVVKHYERGGDDQSNLSADMKPLKLTEQDRTDLIAFLKALTGRPAKITAPELPR